MLCKKWSQSGLPFQLLGASVWFLVSWHDGCCAVPSVTGECQPIKVVKTNDLIILRSASHHCGGRHLRYHCGK
jgi:hypothetical protein